MADKDKQSAVTLKHAKTVSMFRRLAGQHLGAAEFLGASRQFGWVAKYLAGYSVECALKALLLHSTPPSKWDKTYDRITHGVAGHSLEGLKAQLRNGQIEFPSDIAKSFRIVVSWSTELRYKARLVPIEEVREFLARAKTMRDWMEGRL